MRPMFLRLVALLALTLPAGGQDLAGHGGPVGALAVYNGTLVSGGFDTRAILWDLETGQARNVTRFHDGNVTVVALLSDGRFVSGGQDGRIALWAADGRAPILSVGREVSAVASLSVSPDETSIVAGYWDGWVMSVDVASGRTTEQQAHSDRVTGLGHLDSGEFVSIGGDLRFARWSPELELRARADLPELPNGLAVTRGRVAVIFADGSLRLFSADGQLLPERFLTDRPLVAIAATDDEVVTAAIDGTVWILEPRELLQQVMFEAASGPVWSLALGVEQLFSAGADGVIRRWSIADGTRLGDDYGMALAEYTDDSRGAEIWRSCAVCHSLIPDDHSRAGPSLHGVFGQPIATQDGYDYSQALRELEIIWTKTTVAELFQFGPEAYTPGSRMPEQRIADPDDRQALVEFIERASE
jgi:cytochrome c